MPPSSPSDSEAEPHSQTGPGAKNFKPSNTRNPEDPIHFSNIYFFSLIKYPVCCLTRNPTQILAPKHQFGSNSSPFLREKKYFVLTLQDILSLVLFWPPSSLVSSPPLKVWGRWYLSRPEGPLTYSSPHKSERLLRLGPAGFGVHTYWLRVFVCEPEEGEGWE